MDRTQIWPGKELAWIGQSALQTKMAGSDAGPYYFFSGKYKKDGNPAV